MAHKLASTTPRVWHLVDARNQIVGRLAPQIARLLQGKHKPVFMPSVDTGDYVCVINARHAVLTGNKMQDKLYKWHTGFMGGLKTLTARQLQERAPERVLEHAVKGMLPPNATRKDRMRRLRIFPDEAHVHQRQITQSQRYADAYLATHTPTVYTPPAKEETGILVRDYFPGTDPKARAELAKKLVPESKEAALKALEEQFAKERAKAAADLQ